MSYLSANAVTAGYGKQNVIERISFELESGCLMGIIGANGSGKTTLLKALCGILPHRGNCSLENVVFEDLSARQMARLVSYIPQRSGISIDISALDVVLMGFNPRLGLLEHPTGKMKETAMQALAQVGLAGREETNYLHLSEGQKQLCILARTLVSDSRLLLLDEPESALDFRFRHQMLAFLHSWAASQNRSAIVTLHDPTLALNFFDRLLLLSEGGGDPALPGPGNQMVPLLDGFLSLGVPALTRCMESDSPWITVDEIGYLEAQSESYQNAMRKLLGKKRVAAVVRKQELPFLAELCNREDAFVVDLDDSFGNIGCVIMASGLGKRFGGNKLIADFHGEPMICRVLEATEGIFAQRIVVTRSEEVSALCEARGIPVVLHTRPHRSDTVRLGLEVMPRIDRCMFATADQPLLRKETISALALAAVNDPDAVWRTICEGIPGSPVIFPR